MKAFSKMFYADALLTKGTSLPLTTEHEDRGLYVVEGEIAEMKFESGQMMVFRPDDEITVKAVRSSRMMLLGGETLGGPRYIWWNFVASSKEKIEAAKEAWHESDWQHGRFHLPPDDHDEFIPAPEG